MSAFSQPFSGLKLVIKARALRGLGTEILLIDDAVVVDDEGHDAGLAVVAPARR